MNLSSFITTLVRDGQVTVDTAVHAFSPDDLAATRSILLNYYQHDLIDMPGEAPAFDNDTALWAAGFIYRAAQLIRSRPSGNNGIEQWLPKHAGATGPEAIYSADLCLRYLPDLLSIAKKLAPADPLVQRLTETAAQWPFSSTGMNIYPAAPVTAITEHPSLLQAYTDRIIASKDTGRCNDPVVMTAVKASLGSYADLLWPGFHDSFRD
ncbi:hypothetical protein HF329_32740 [Chitinophaga oryzae]|uniref:MoxR-vWA-beta-propeller ternary system domain-containing protein n=1 Tax=Chitinophaga oryzae TaxID=2725414 RepID=A0AAE6ZNG1_9BACT|nr:hypothetical protein [Chitinophaga oryzae]QJB35817.1 hypothetical protein HF329_32740 [Chitinophaga oryzae]